MTSNAPANERQDRDRWIALVVLCAGFLMIILDQTIVNVALPSIQMLARDEGIGLARGADLLGALLIVAALMLAVYTIVGAADHGWGSLHTVGLGALAFALLVAFVGREATTRTPLMPLRIFRSRIVSVANLVQALMVAGLFGMFF